jgi:hypothetical protein
MKKSKTSTALLAIALAVFSALPASAASVAGLFGQGRSHWTITGGSGYAFEQSYFVLGVGASYNLLDGFSVGLHAERWFDGEPGITNVTPSLQYVFYKVRPMSPYVGAFFRRAYIDDRPDLDSTGGRAGVYLGSGRNAYFGAGMVHESYRDCNETVYRDCTDVYPEFSFTFVF